MEPKNSGRPVDSIRRSSHDLAWSWPDCQYSSPDVARSLSRALQLLGAARSASVAEASLFRGRELAGTPPFGF